MNTTIERHDRAVTSRVPTHVVFAMNVQEMAAFFGEVPDLSRQGVTQASLSPEECRGEHEWAEALRAARPGILVTAWSCPRIPEAWGLEADCPLQYVCSVTGSVKPRVPRTLIERGLRVTNWGGLVSWAVAEHALLLVLGLLRCQTQWRLNLCRRPWEEGRLPLLPTRTLRGAKVGLHGFGAVARDLATMLRPFDVEVAAWSEGVPPGLMVEFGVKPCDSLAELFDGREVLIECEGLNERSRGSVTADLLESLAPGAVFVNVGRGPVVDEEALLRMACGKRLRVGLDVFHREPLPEDSPWLRCEGVLLSPHVAGPAADQYLLCGQRALENVGRFLRGEELDREVTLEIYDRAT